MVNEKCPLKNMLCPVKSLDEPGIFSCHVCLQWKKLNSEHQILIILRLDIIGVLGENTGEERYC